MSKRQAVILAGTAARANEIGLRHGLSYWWPSSVADARRLPKVRPDVEVYVDASMWGHRACEIMADFAQERLLGAELGVPRVE